MATILCVIPAILAFGMCLCSLLGKGLLLNNTWLWASEQERKRMNKVPYYRQSGIVFGLLGVVFSLLATETILKTKWLLYIAAAVGVAVLIYAVVSSAVLDKKK